MSRKLFGTDGVRGRANTHPMTAEMALKLLSRHQAREASVIGKGQETPGCVIPGSMPLSDALAMMLVKGCGRLWVTREGEAPGVLDFDGLMTFFREGEANGR